MSINQIPSTFRNVLISYIHHGDPFINPIFNNISNFFFQLTPFPSLFDENLKEVDLGISKVFALVNGLFTDGKTAYVFTADHGMSNKGLHLNSKFYFEKNYGSILF